MLEKLVFQGNAEFKHVNVGAFGISTIHVPNGKVALVTNVRYHYFLALDAPDPGQAQQRSQYQLTLIERGTQSIKFNEHYRTPYNRIYDPLMDQYFFTLAQDVCDTKVLIRFDQDIMLELVRPPLPSNWQTAAGTTTAATQEPREPLGQGTGTAVANAVHRFTPTERYYPTTQFRQVSNAYTAGVGLRDELRFNVNVGRKDSAYGGPGALTYCEPFSYPIVSITMYLVNSDQIPNLM